MSDHLFFEGKSLLEYHIPFQHISHLEYVLKRVQFWKYRKKRTMGRPILMLWHPTTKPTIKEGI